MDVPLFAADVFGIIFGIIFVIISVVSALSNMAKEKNNPQPGKQKEKAALQKELEKFLQDAMNPQQKGKPAEVDFFEEDIKVEAPVQQSPQRRQRQQEQTPPQRQRSQLSQQGKQNRKSVVNPIQTHEDKPHVTHRERAEKDALDRQKRLGGALRDRIEQQQKSHIPTSIHDHLGGNFNKHLSETFGSRRNESLERAPRAEGLKVIRGLIKNPESLRQAIILNEILSPPKSLRRSSE